MTISDLKNNWQDTPEYHKHIHESFIELVNNDELLNEHRTWVENNVFGFGERSFWWLWKLICDEMPHDAKMLEVGVFKGATISLWQTIPCLPGNIVYGISPMDGTGLEWKQDDYRQHIINIHERFEQEMPIIFEGLSEDKEIIETANRVAPFDCVYIDGGHERRHIDNDLHYYAPLVKNGGYLVIDDAACWMNMPFGYFQGIQPVSDGLVDYMKEHGSEWEFITNVVHIMVYKRI